MYFMDVIRKLKDNKIKIFVDMDGVIADYDVGNPSRYDIKRPLISNITKLEKVAKIERVELFILSVSRKNVGIEEKNIWLDKNAPFFKKENRVIIAREANDFQSAKRLKANFFQQLKREDCKYILIDDDPAVLKEIMETSEDIMLLKDTVLVD